MERTQNAGSKRALMWLGGVVVVLLALGTVVALTQTDPEFEPGTPEAVAQGYITAVFDRDPDAAFAFLSDELQERCPVEEFRHAWVPESARVVITETDIDADRATVSIRISERQPGEPFTMGEVAYEETLVMTRTGDAWRISEVPWPVFGCPERIAP